MKIDSKTTVSELMRQYPQTIDFFIKRKMLCVGCPCQDYHTLADVAWFYGYEVEKFLETIRTAALSEKHDDQQQLGTWL